MPLQGHRAPLDLSRASIESVVVFDGNNQISTSIDALKEPKYHAHYSHSLSMTDIELISTDGIYFRVHTVVLRLASSFFNDLLDLPRDPSESQGDPIQTQEHSSILSCLLDIIYPGREVPTIPSFELLKGMLAAADKYDMPKVTSSLRTLAMKSPLFLSNSLELYVLACRYQWEDEAKWASKGTHNFDLSDPSHSKALASLNAHDLMRLQSLHRRRKRELFEDLDLHNTTSRLDWTKCLVKSSHVMCNHRKTLDGPVWNLWRYQACEAMEMGEKLQDRTFYDQPNMVTIWGHACTSCRCYVLVKDATISEIQRVLGLLPQNV